MKKILILLSMLLFLLFTPVFATGSQEGEDAPKPVTFTMFHPNSGKQISPQDSPILAHLTELTNVQIEYILPAGGAEERLYIMLASNADDLPDLINFTDNQVNIMDQFIESGKLINIEPIMKTEAPEVYNFNYESFREKIRNADGNMYYMPSGYNFGPGTDTGAYTYADYGFSARTGFLEANDWYDPVDLDSVHTLLKMHKEEYPDMSPMGLALGPDGFLDDLNMTGAGAYALVSNWNDLILNDDNTVSYWSDLPQMKEWYQYLNMLYREGLIDIESPLMSKDMLKEKVLGGKVFSWFGPGWEIGTSFISNRMNQGDDEYVRYWFFPRANDAIEKTTYGPLVDNLYKSGVSITTACEDPARFMQFYEYLNTEEGYWNARGIVNWEFTGENTPEETAGYDWIALVNAEQTRPGKTPVRASAFMGDEWGKNSDFHWKRGLNNFDMFLWGFTNHPNGKYDVIGDQDVTMWWDERAQEVQAAYGWTGKNYIDKHKESGCDPTLMAGIDLDPDSDELLISNKLKAYKQTKLPKIIVAETEANFETLWLEMVAKFDSEGKQQYIDLMNEIVNQRMFDWGLK